MAAGASKATINRAVRRVERQHPGKAVQVLRASNGEVAVFAVCSLCREPKWLCSHPEQWK